MTDEQFRQLCNTFGFAPSRALREMIDCATARAEAQRDALLAVVNKLEYSSDGYIKRYPEESEVSAAIAKAEENT